MRATEFAEGLARFDKHRAEAAVSGAPVTPHLPQDVSHLLRGLQAEVATLGARQVFSQEEPHGSTKHSFGTGTLQ